MLLDITCIVVLDDYIYISYNLNTTIINPNQKHSKVILILLFKMIEWISHNSSTAIGSPNPTD